MPDALSYYCQKLVKLKVNRYGTEAAPHKPVLLLALLDLARKGQLPAGRVTPSDTLLIAFRNRWAALVESKHYQPTLYLPFWHLKSDGFWKLVPWPGQQGFLDAQGHAMSWGTLQRTVSHAQLADDLAALLQDPAASQELERTLLQHWFGKSPATQPAPTLEERYRELILAAEPLPAYGQDLADETALLEQALFRRTVVEAYDGRCAVTGVRHTWQGRPVLVDAHHIQGSSLNGLISASSTSERHFFFGASASLLILSGYSGVRKGVRKKSPILCSPTGV